MTFQNMQLQFWHIFQQLLRGIFVLQVWGILSSFLCPFQLFSDITVKGFNIGEDIFGVCLKYVIVFTHTLLF